MSKFSYQVTEYFKPSVEAEEIISIITRFEGSNILKCKELAEQFYISKLPYLNTVSEFNNLLLFKLDFGYIPEDINEWEKLNYEPIIYPEYFGGSPKEWAESEEDLLKEEGVEINIPVWSERVEILKKKYGYLQWI